MRGNSNVKGWYVDLTTVDSVFNCCFAAPAATIPALGSLTPLIAIDGTFLMTQYKQVPLMAVASDAPGHNTPLAWSIVPCKDKRNWSYFLKDFRNVFPIASNPWHLFISKRNKRPLTSVESFFPSNMHLYCCQHIAQNVEREHGAGRSDASAETAAVRLWSLCKKAEHRGWRVTWRRWEPDGARQL